MVNFNRWQHAYNLFLKKGYEKMKFAVITDIHGNASALQAVFADIDYKQEIEHIYCLGDMIALGPDSNEVLDMLFSRKNVSIVTGNHDEAVLAIIQGQDYPLGHSHIFEHHVWVASRLDVSYTSFLERLPRNITVSLEGFSILFQHYHIASNKMDEHISNDPFSQIVKPTIYHLKKLFNKQDENLICFGHSHTLHYFEDKSTIYLNPGSLGCNYTPTAPYAIVTIENGKIQVSLENVPYDNASFLLSFEKLQVPQRSFILDNFHGSQQNRFV